MTNADTDVVLQIPVCAIGASAGGVAALQKFFSHVGDDLGLAFVVIVHLAPDQPSSMSEILAARTRMPVQPVEGQAKLQPNCVYVIPPNRELVIHDNDITARPFREPRGRRSPIDLFFRSIASARGEGMAVVLSGSGSDGALGVRAIREAGGISFAQDPNEADYPMMPESAIATGAIDFVGSVAQLAAHIAQVVRSKDAVREIHEGEAEKDISQIINLLRRRTGHDFTNYKRATILRRVARRMQVTQQASLSAYYGFLQNNPEEAKQLFADFLISVTSFFRDAAAFTALAERAVAPIFEQRDDEAPIRVWVVGCATGEEAYSIGMLLLEEANRRNLDPLIQIFASDLDEAALATARDGRYPKAIEADVTEERLRRFFMEDGPNYRVRKELRDIVLFARHSALRDPPFIKLDLISCRNLLIYLQRDVQRQLCGIFHYALNPNGFLFLGSAETVDTATPLFTTVDRDARIYATMAHAEKLAPILPELTADHRLRRLEPKTQPAAEPPIGVSHAHAAALEQHAPPSVLVDSSHRILYLSANASRFFRPMEGPFSSELPAQARPELRVDLKLALRRALENGETTVTMPVGVGFNGERRLVFMYVAPASPKEGEAPCQALVLFLDAGKPETDETPDDGDVNREEVRRLRRELDVAQDRVSVSRREHEVANQDLRAANEELQSINEEYRSTAEELETSKEELQSMNEELQTVNNELKTKLEAISSAHNDLQNLMAATEIGTLFLGPDLNIKLFTPPIAHYFNVTDKDIGRPLSDFTNRLDYADLEQDVAKVLQTLVPAEREVATQSRHWLLIGLRPYRTVDGKIEGVVMTLTDITTRKRAEEGLSKELRAMQLLQQLSTKVLESQSLAEPLSTVLDVIVELIGADFGNIQLYDETSRTLRIVAQRGFDKRFLDHFATVDVTEASACGLALAKRQQVLIEDVEKEPAYAPNLAEAKAAGYRAVCTTPLVTGAGKLVGMFSTHFRAPHRFSAHDLRVSDICARQAADAIHAHVLQQTLREADRRKDEFLAILAHELRNPLAVISSASHLLKRANPAPKDTERLHETIAQQVSHLSRLVEDLVDVSRITRGKIELRPQLVDLNEIVRQALQSIQPMIESKLHEVKTVFAARPLLVWGDPVRLVQIFTNLLENSAKYTPANGRIEISTKQDAGFAEVRISDNGPGLSAEMLTQIFELFVRFEGGPGFGQSGIGVGLALSRSLVSLHGGSIEAFSEGLGKGSAFVVRLPLSNSGLEKTSNKRPPESFVSARVVVVDDNKEVADGLTMLLKTLGVDVRTVYGGPEALIAIADFKPDIAFVDIGMPIMDGYELARKIKATPEGQKIVLAAITGWGDDDHRQRGLNAGFAHHFVKPVDMDQLQNLLAALPVHASD